MTRKIIELAIYLRVVEEHDSLPPMPAAADIVTTGEDVTETLRPIAKCGAQRVMKAAGSR